MDKLNELFKSHPEFKFTPSHSGCPETDANCRPYSVFVTGESSKAETTTDACVNFFKELGYEVKRTGPRTLRVVRDYTVRHHTDESVSF